MGDTAQQGEDFSKEGMAEVKDFFTIEKTDSELVSMINAKVQGAYTEYEKLKKEGQTNERYWAQNQLEGINLYWHNSRIVQNRIYMSVETMVPIITSKPAEPMIGINTDEGSTDPKDREFVRDVEKLLLDKYYDPDFPQQEMYEMIARHLLLYKVGIPKIRWDDTIDDFIVEFVHPHKVIISPNGHYNGDVWTAEYMEWTLKEIVAEFPEKEKEIMDQIFPGAVDKNSVMGSPIGFWEYWSEDGSYLVWKMQSVILQKKLNPYINWNNKKFDKKSNHFKYPKKPLMFLNSQNLGRHIWDDTTPVSQGLSIQDGINLMQRIITDTARDQGILVGASGMIDRDELYKYTGAHNEKLSVKGEDPSKALYRVPPKPLAPEVPNNLVHLESAMDNIMGTHSVTRGEKSRNPTLGQDQISKEGDSGRIDAIVRGIERIATEVYNWELQMMVVKYKKEHYANVVGEKKAEEVMKRVKESIKRRIKISVKPGSTLPTDKMSQRSEAVELAKAGKISDIDFFERMDFPNPKEMAERLYQQASAPETMFPDLVKKLEKDGKKKAEKEGKLDENGNIIPDAVPQVMPQVDPNTGMPIQVPPQAIPNQVPPVAQPAVAPEQQLPADPQIMILSAGTEHTQALLQGQAVQPFEGIDPANYQTHLSAELQFMGSDDFAQLPEELQASYAKHVLEERQLLQSQ